MKKMWVVSVGFLCFAAGQTPSAAFFEQDVAKGIDGFSSEKVRIAVAKDVAADIPTGKSACFLSVNGLYGNAYSVLYSCDGSKSEKLPAKSNTDETVSYWVSQFLSKGYKLNSCSQIAADIANMTCVFTHSGGV